MRHEKISMQLFLFGQIKCLTRVTAVTQGKLRDLKLAGVVFVVVGLSWNNFASIGDDIDQGHAYI
jgi:hypothetical protein